MTNNDKHKILVVEDETSLAGVLRDKLVDEGFDVRVSGDGVDALEQVEQWSPDLVLLDIILPKMDGMTMLHKMRELPDHAKTQVIMLTNLSGTDKVYDAIANGVFDFLIKSNWKIEDVIKEVKSKLS